MKAKSLHSNRAGFTLTELLIGMLITSIILSAVVTLSYAMSSANDGCNDTSLKQAQLRYATLRISDLIRNCKLIAYANGYDIGIWRSDDNGNGKININELVYIGCDSDRDCLRIFEFSSMSNPIVNRDMLGPIESEWWSSYGNNNEYIMLVPQCSNMQITTDLSPPWSKSANISFDLQENGQMHNYQITATLRNQAAHLLDESGHIVPGDDD